MKKIRVPECAVILPCAGKSALCPSLSHKFILIWPSSLPVSAPLSPWLSPSPDSSLVQFHVSPLSSSDSCLNGRIRPTTRLDLLWIYKELSRIFFAVYWHWSPWWVLSHGFMITHIYFSYFLIFFGRLYTAGAGAIATMLGHTCTGLLGLLQ